MADVKPFRGIHYDVKRVGDLTRVVAPPYDVISPEEQEALHRRHPRNITWVDFGMAKEGDGPGENKYTRAAAWFREWLAEGTLVRDAVPSLYYYEQEFTIPGKRTYVRKGFLGALKLSAFGEGEVFPHERTLSKPKEDRLALMRVTDVHMSPIFSLYSDPRDEVLKSLRSAMAAAPDMAAVDDLGVKHRIWTVSTPKALLGAVEGMKGKGVFIADGHHRYETALAFREEMRARHGVNPGAAYEHVLMFLCNMDDEGIVILPTHRGIHSLADFSGAGFLAKVRAHLPVESRDGSPEDAMRAVPMSLREGSYAMGATRYQTATRVVVPAAVSGIAAAYILGISRAVGETMILAVAAGMQPNLTFNPMEPAATITAYIVQVALGDLPHGSVGYQTIFAAGLTLLLFTLAFNIIGHMMRRRFREAY